MTIPSVTPSAPEPDVAVIVHEEVDRLPEKHRLPVVLCDLDGLTYEQAAGQLRWTVPTLLPAGEGPAAAPRTAGPAGHHRRGDRDGPRDVDGRGKGGGPRGPRPIGGRRGDDRDGLGDRRGPFGQHHPETVHDKLKIAAGGALAAIALASAGVIAVGAWRPDPPRVVMAPQSGAEMKRPSAAKETTTPSPVTADWIEVRGRVVDPQGRPVAGAAVRTAYLDQDIKPAPETASGPDGRFTLRVPPWRRNSALRRADAMFPWVVASAPGFGPGWASAVHPLGGAEEATIRLVEDGPPIEGRIVNLEGRPVAGARIKAEFIYFAREGSLTAWLERARDGGIDGPWRGLDRLPASLIATTGADGRFRLTGLGRDRLADLLVSAPSIATAQLYVADRDGTPIRSANPRAMMDRETRTTYYSRRFEYAAEPTQPIEGIVRDKDTRHPIAGLLLRAMVYEEHSLVPAPGIEAKTDAQGHYRLTGLPKGPAYRLFLEPGKGQPYLNATFQTPAGSPALEPISFDIALKRGVLVRGRVTDKATGRPVSGYVNAFAFADNPNVDEFPGYRSSYVSYAHLGDDGRYEVVALPGRGLIACRSDLGRYRGGVGASTIKGHDPQVYPGLGGFHTLPHNCHVADYHVLAEVNPAPGAESATLDLQVDPGRSLTIHAVDPEGHPLGAVTASGLTDLFSSIAYEQDAPTIEVHALDPSKPRRVTLIHEGRKLVGAVYLTGDEAGPLTVRLQPSGTVAGRIVDEDGRPRAGLALSNLGGIYPEPPPDRAILPESRSGAGHLVGRDGRFRIEGLIPGLKYEAGAVQGNFGQGEVFRDLIVAPGEVKDLGDVKVVPYKRGD